jgi:transposase
MIVIGADIHKSTHALAAVSGDGGLVAGELEIRADESGHLAALRWARELDEERVWAIEDCRHLSRRFEQALITAGERVVRVPPRMMGQARRGEREPGKSDQIDARAVARAVVREGVERFPTAFLDERALEIRLLGDHRSDLVNLERKRAEGKSNREALRCLKRHLARHVHRLLSMPPINPDHRTRIQLNSAISVPCLT